MNSPKIIPLILCGGTGKRLWPLSRQSFPKQFLNILSEKEYSLFQETYLRISDINAIQKPILLCNEEHRFIVAEQMREINVKPQSIILEPFGRNTAPAIALGALKALEIYEDPILLVLSSDHEIKDSKKFREVIQSATQKVLEGKLITFGITPTNPETGYGYIESEEFLDEVKNLGSPIKRFYEKPSIENAKKYIENKCFTWNSGIFLFKAKSVIEDLEKYSPEILDLCRNSLKEKNLDLDFQRINKKHFEICPNISIDVAVMEKTNKGFVFPLNAGWSDLGDWNSIWKNSKKDKNGNTLKGKVFVQDTKNCYMRTENSLITGIGLDNLIIVDTSDAILIADKNKTQDVKLLLNNLERKGIAESYQHKKIYRPWGFYISLEEGPRWQIKVISVNPGASLSLQMHHHRSEHWIVVSGTAQVELDSKKMILNENQSTYIPVCSKHRLSNPGKIQLELIEVQSGSYLGEDDITRYEDAYNRVKGFN